MRRGEDGQTLTTREISVPALLSAVEKEKIKSTFGLSASLLSPILKSYINIYKYISQNTVYVTTAKNSVPFKTKGSHTVQIAAWHRCANINNMGRN